MVLGDRALSTSTKEFFQNLRRSHKRKQEDSSDSSDDDDFKPSLRVPHKRRSVSPDVEAMERKRREEVQKAKIEMKSLLGHSLDMAKPAGRLFVGCCGYQFEHWRNGVFYPEGMRRSEELGEYVSHFNSVEIESTLTEIPNADRVEKWHGAVFGRGGNFAFSFQMNKGILEPQDKEPEEFWKEFCEPLKALDDYRGVINFKMPKQSVMDIEALIYISTIVPDHYRIAFEFHHPSWFCEDTYKVLRQNNWALVLNDHPYNNYPLDKVTASYVYIKMNGPSRLYSSSYTYEQLGVWAKRIQEWMCNGLDIYTYFANDQEGYSLQNAKALRDLVQRL